MKKFLIVFLTIISLSTFAKSFDYYDYNYGNENKYNQVMNTIEDIQSGQLKREVNRLIDNKVRSELNQPINVISDIQYELDRIDNVFNRNSATSYSGGNNIYSSQINTDNRNSASKVSNHQSGGRVIFQDARTQVIELANGTRITITQ